MGLRSAKSTQPAYTERLLPRPKLVIPYLPYDQPNPLSQPTQSGFYQDQSLQPPNPTTNPHPSCAGRLQKIICPRHSLPSHSNQPTNLTPPNSLHSTHINITHSNSTSLTL